MSKRWTERYPLLNSNGIPRPKAVLQIPLSKRTGPRRRLSSIGRTIGNGWNRTPASSTGNGISFLNIDTTIMSKRELNVLLSSKRIIHNPLFPEELKNSNRLQKIKLPTHKPMRHERQQKEFTYKDKSGPQGTPP